MKSSKKLVKIIIKKIKDKVVCNEIDGVPSGFVEIDKATRGWQPGQLIVIAGSDGMAKSAFTKSMILNIAIKFNQAVAIFSLEKSAIHYLDMMIRSETKTNRSILNRDYDLCDLKKKLRNLSKAPIFIDDTPSISLYDLKRNVIQLKSKKDIIY